MRTLATIIFLLSIAYCNDSHSAEKLCRTFKVKKGLIYNQVVVLSGKGQIVSTLDNGQQSSHQFIDIKKRKVTGTIKFVAVSNKVRSCVSLYSKSGYINVHKNYIHRSK